MLECLLVAVNGVQLHAMSLVITATVTVTVMSLVTAVVISNHSAVSLYLLDSHVALVSSFFIMHIIACPFASHRSHCYFSVLEEPTITIAVSFRARTNGTKA